MTSKFFRFELKFVEDGGYNAVAAVSQYGRLDMIRSTQVQIGVVILDTFEPDETMGWTRQSAVTARTEFGAKT